MHTWLSVIMKLRSDSWNVCSLKLSRRSPSSEASIACDLACDTRPGSRIFHPCFVANLLNLSRWCLSIWGRSDVVEVFPEYSYFLDAQLVGSASFDFLQSVISESEYPQCVETPTCILCRPIYLLFFSKKWWTSAAEVLLEAVISGLLTWMVSWAVGASPWPDCWVGREWSSLSEPETLSISIYSPAAWMWGRVERRVGGSPCSRLEVVGTLRRWAIIKEERAEPDGEWIRSSYLYISLGGWEIVIRSFWKWSSGHMSRYLCGEQKFIRRKKGM